MAQKVTTVGELREALSDCEDDQSIYSVTDCGELSNLFIYNHKRKREIGFAFEIEMVIVFETDSPHWEFKLHM